LKGDVLLKTIEIRKFNPATGGKNKKERKRKLRRKIKKAIGKDLKKVRKRCYEKPLALYVCFYLLRSTEQGRTKKDLDNLLKIVCDVLQKNMIAQNKEVRFKGLDLMEDDSSFFEINCVKKLVDEPAAEGLDLSISESSES